MSEDQSDRLYQNTAESRNSSQTSAAKRFVCNVCTKGFSSKQCLREHMYIHSNQKPYSCAICKKKLRHASQYTLHKKSHAQAAKHLWPKLTDLLKKHREYQIQSFEYFEKVVLPQLGREQEFQVPGYEELMLRMIPDYL
jgi:hypothetical protein